MRLQRSSDTRETEDRQRPLVTVGIPFRDAAPTLLQAVRSVLAQTYTNWELLLIDDGSRDDSADIAYQIVDPRVRVIADGQHLGLISRLNRIAQLANGSLLARMDSDDLMHPSRLEAQVRLFAENPSLSVSSTWAYSLSGRSRLLGVRESEVPTRITLLWRNPVIHSTVMMRTDWARTHRYGAGFGRGEDVELWMRTADDGRFMVINRPLLFYDETSSLSTSKYIRTAVAYDRMLRKFGPRLVGIPVTALLRVRNVSKLAASVLLMTIGLGGFLLRLRCRRPTPSERRELKAALSAISKVQVRIVRGPLKS